MARASKRAVSFVLMDRFLLETGRMCPRRSRGGGLLRAPSAERGGVDRQLLLGAQPLAAAQTVPLLDDYDREALTVERGTLTNSERKMMQSHVSKTYEMLKEMNFEGPYKDVPDWAGKHHELLDGSGYPNKVNGEVITWETRLLTILDIYDALTAEDRPYKPPLPAEKAFEILRDMANNGKIDLNVLEDFIKSEAWK